MGGEQLDWVGDVPGPTPRKSGDELKAEGMRRARESHETLFEKARAIAIELGKLRGEITADDVMEELLRRRPSTNLGNAAGSLFRGNQWVFTGKWRKSTRPANHSHQNRVWRYQP